MIKIASNKDRNITEICSEHHIVVKPQILARLGQSLLARTINKCQADFIRANIDDILKGTPPELEQLFKDYIAHCKAHRCKNFKKGVSAVFNYSRFSSKATRPYNAYDLAVKLNVKVCPYCNRQYTFTVVTTQDSIIRPEFDHFLSKSDFPIFSMSFYNLVPSCKVCNSSLKHNKKFKLSTHVHPYLDGFSDKVTFDYNPYDTQSALGFDANLDVILRKQDCLINERQLDGNIKVFKIAETYQGHKDIVRDIVRKFYISDGRYMESLLKSFPQIGSYEELYRLAFGNYFNDEDMDQRVLSKLTRDLVKSLDFIVPVIE
jgi:hypothetical protein